MQSAQRLPSMIQGLEYLKGCNVPVDFIIDVGILTCTYPLIHCFPDRKHILVEPVRSFHTNIESIYKSKNIDHLLLKCAAGKSNEKLVLCEYGKRGGTEVTHSRLFDVNADIPNEDLISKLIIDTKRVDTLLEMHKTECCASNDKYDFLLKIDVDGTEEDILEGSRNCLGQCSVIVLEIPIVKLLGRVSLLDQLGYQIVDIVDPCYYKGCLSQVDCIFVRKDLMRVHQVDPWQRSSSIDFSAWYEGRYIYAT